MELEQLLQLCQAYGVTSFKSQEYQIELTPLGMQEIDYGDDDSEEFGVEVSKMEILENN